VLLCMWRRDDHPELSLNYSIVGNAAANRALLRDVH
jgi:hypothetical protein